MIYDLKKKKKKIEQAENLALCLQPPARIDGVGPCWSGRLLCFSHESHLIPMIIW